MVKIRLSRTGARSKPCYRIVVADGRSPRDGHQLEVIGTFDPKPGSKKTTLKADRLRYWLGVGAKPTSTVKALVKKMGPEEKRV